MDRKDAETQRRVQEEPPPHLRPLTYNVIGACIEVHRQLGPGFLEQVYEEAVCVELASLGIGVQRQVALPVLYKGRVIAESRLDLLVEEELVLELKAVEALRPVHHAQVRSYLRAGEFQLGLLINFNVAVLKDAIYRVVWTG
jgi:GxxExxY protein